jgi:hypothetical protein
LSLEIPPPAQGAGLKNRMRCLGVAGAMLVASGTETQGNYLKAIIS